MKPAVAYLSIIAVLAVVSDADGHCYSIWRYNFPQRCSAPIRTHWQRLSFVRFERHKAMFERHPSDDRVTVEIRLPVYIPLPSLTAINWGREADDAVKRAVLLRAMVGQ